MSSSSKYSSDYYSQNSKNLLDAWVQKASDSPLITWLLPHVHNTMDAVGFVDPQSYPTPQALVYTLLVVYATAIVLLLAMRSRSRRRQRHQLLNQELAQAREQLRYLQEKLRMNSQLEEQETQQVRIFMDGAFDLMHYGHMNAFRLARSLGTHLVVGINDDKSISECKGNPPLMNDAERTAMVASCKFVDEVVPGCPYIMNKDYLESIIDKYHIDYVVHGDDPCIVDGKDVYATAKECGKYKSIPRTEGVSTTDIVGRMLIMTKEHHLQQTSSSTSSSSTAVTTTSARNSNNNTINGTSGGDNNALLSQQSKFLTTSRMLKLFSSGVKAPAQGAKVVYIDGSFDMFHPGHVSVLKRAKQRGDYLIVGVHNDAVVNRVLGMNLPLLNLHERVLSVLGCRYVDDVLIDAPYEINEEMVASLNIAEVLESPDTGYGGAKIVNGKEEDRYRLVRRELRHDLGDDTACEFSLQNVFQRIHRNQEMFEARFERKMNAEQEFYKEKHASISNGA